MAQYQNFNYLLRTLRNTNRNTQSRILKDIAEVVTYANRRDLQEFLELLNSTNDKDLQTKLLSILAAYLVSNNTCKDVVVTYTPLYDTIQSLLSGGLKLGTTATLDFVSALLSYDDEESESLAMYTRNMLRVSGCLSIMAYQFAESMMYQDTWIALCRALSDTCRASEINQNYCSHLVPVCVQKCHQGPQGVDACAVLLSLLHNHQRNINLFLECNGVSVFKRELLHYDSCMQLLATIIVKRSTQAASLLRQTHVVEHIQDFLNLYGPHSQTGQWSTIILYHLNAQTGQESKVASDDKHETLNKLKNAPFPKSASITAKLNDAITNATNGRIDNEFDNTADLFRNVIKEMNYWKSKNKPYFLKPVISDQRFQHLNQVNTLFTEKEHNTNSQLDTPCVNWSKVFRRSKEHNSIETCITASDDKELSFSFLLRQNLLESRKTHDNEKILSQCDLTHNYSMSSPNNVNYTKKHHCSIKQQGEKYFNTMQEDSKPIDLKHFQPAFVSTPKRQTNAVNLTQISSVAKCSSDIDGYKHVRKRQVTHKPNICKNTSPVQLKRSASARLFSAINDSCTTFVKSVKSIFKAKNKNNPQTTVKNENNVADDHNSNCSYSFTNYMRKRDAVMANSTNTQSNVSMITSELDKFNSCETCNDTMMLKNKLANDEYLKKTVKKLKLGINLFGCDFKKISRTMWPRERYMKPNVLYNLYRKLIVKKKDFYGNK